MAETTMLQKIKERLLELGYTVSGSEEPGVLTTDETAVLFLVNKTENYIRDFCNIAEIPESLEQSEIEMVCVEFLKGKALSGGLDETGISADSISSITEGDVSVSYSGGSAFVLSQFYEDARKKFEADLMPFRAMRW